MARKVGGDVSSLLQALGTLKPPCGQVARSTEEQQQEEFKGDMEKNFLEGYRRDFRGTEEGTTDTFRDRDQKAIKWNSAHFPE